MIKMPKLILIISTLVGFILGDKHLNREQRETVKKAFGEKLSIDDLKGE